MRLFSRRLLVDADSIRAAGTLVDGMSRSGGPAMIYLGIGMLLADEAAAVATSDTKGASGLLPCLVCANVYGRMHEQQDDPLHDHDDTGILVDITCNDTDQFVPRGDHDLWHAADVLAALKPVLLVGQFEEQERVRGLNYNPYGTLCDQELRLHYGPVSCHVYDAAHVFLCSGLGHREFSLLFQGLENAGIAFRTIAKALGQSGGPLLHWAASKRDQSGQRPYRNNGRAIGEKPVTSVPGPANFLTLFLLYAISWKHNRWKFVSDLAKN
jgi:hypothetical protein